MEKTGTDTRARTDGHGHADTKDGQLWKRRALIEKTDSYGKDGYMCIYFELNAKCKRNNNNTNQRYGFPELPDASVGLY